MTLEMFIGILKKYVNDTVEITSESLLLENLGLDSFRVMQVVYECENNGYVFNFDECVSIKKVKDLFGIIHTGEE